MIYLFWQIVSFKKVSLASQVSAVRYILHFYYSAVWALLLKTTGVLQNTFLCFSYGPCADKIHAAVLEMVSVFPEVNININTVKREEWDRGMKKDECDNVHLT